MTISRTKMGKQSKRVSVSLSTFFFYTRKSIDLIPRFIFLFPFFCWTLAYHIQIKKNTIGFKWNVIFIRTWLKYNCLMNLTFFSSSASSVVQHNSSRRECGEIKKYTWKANQINVIWLTLLFSIFIHFNSRSLFHVLLF